MSIKGEKKEILNNSNLFVGFSKVRVVAVNPNREEINGFLKKSDEDALSENNEEPTLEDKKIEYLSTSDEEVKKLRLLFLLKDVDNDRFFFHNLYLRDEYRNNIDGTKYQLVNQTCNTTWMPILEGTDKVDESLIPDWFSNFKDKEGNIIAPKKFRKAFKGEEELVTLLRAWTNKLKYFDSSTEVLLDMDKLFKGDVSELKDLISLNENLEFSEEGIDTEFIVLLGVETNKDDTYKKYQNIYNKKYLPSDFMRFINNGNKFPTDYSKKMWLKFVDEVKGEYGFKSYTDLVPLRKYDESKDISGTDNISEKVPLPESSDY